MMRALGLSLALLFCAAPAGAQEVERARANPQASIPFADLGGIRNFRPGPNGTLLLEGTHRRWYRATFFGSCPDAAYAETIGIITDHAGSVDRFSGIIVRGRQCRFRSLVEIPDPDARANAPTKQ